MTRALALLLLLLSTSVAARQPAFKSGVALVTVPISVTNAARDKLIVAGLGPDDFRVFEDGEPQTVVSLRQDRLSVSLCVVVDASGSMAAARRYDSGIEGLRRTAAGLTAGDELAIVRFAGGVTTLLPWAQQPDAKHLSWDLDPKPGLIANSSITDGVKAALEEIERAANPRRVILIISDGYENASVTPHWQLARTRGQSEAPIYAFGVAGPRERAPSGGPLVNVLPALVGESGGVYWQVSTPVEAEFAAASLINDLKYQYVLAYAPRRPFDGKYRRIKVETTVDGLRLRHRGGYLALPAQ